MQGTDFLNRIATAAERAQSQQLSQCDPETRQTAHAIMGRLSEIIPEDAGMKTTRNAIGTRRYRAGLSAALLAIVAVNDAIGRVEDRVEAEDRAAKARRHEDLLNGNPAAEVNALATEAQASQVYHVHTVPGTDFVALEPQGETIQNLDGNGLPLMGSVGAEAETVAAV